MAEIHHTQARRRWVEIYAQTRDAGLTCRRCGISRPTLRKWWRRYQAEGEEGLQERSRRPHHPPTRKLTPEHRSLILKLRRERKLGHKRIQAELLRLHQVRLSTATIWKVLHQEAVPPRHRRCKPKQPKSYSRPVPGDRVQLDTFKVAPGLYQYTATDDCTRMRVLGLYPARTAKNAVHFLEERLLEEFPFPIQRIQTDRGGEFFGMAFQKALREQCIKFRPIPPRSPHLNGKVERSQQTDWVEFYATVDLQDPELEDRLGKWQFFYNWYRPHSALGGRTPMDRCCELLEKTPLRWVVCEAYEFAAPEPFRERNFQVDSRIRRLKRSL